MYVPNSKSKECVCVARSGTVRTRRIPSKICSCYNTCLSLERAVLHITLHTAHTASQICRIRMMMSTSAVFEGRCHHVVAREDQRLLPTSEHAIQQFTAVRSFAKRWRQHQRTAPAHQHQRTSTSASVERAGVWSYRITALQASAIHKRYDDSERWFDSNSNSSQESAFAGHFCLSKSLALLFKVVHKIFICLQTTSGCPPL